MDIKSELQIQFASHTILGKEKKYNTDICESFELVGGMGIVLCDGVDGINNEGGALAAKLALEGVKRHFKRNPIKNPIKALQGAMMLANFSVYDHAMKNERFLQMGVNILLVIVVDNLIYYASTGNNALVLQREGVLYQLVKPNIDDQLPVVLLGREKYTRFSICKNPIQAINNDVILCASDGVFTVFSDQQIAELLYQDDISIDLLSYQIIFKLEEQQTSDNATVALARLTDKNDLPPEGKSVKSEVVDLNDMPEINHFNSEFDHTDDDTDNQNHSEETKENVKQVKQDKPLSIIKNKRVITVFALVLLASIILILSLDYFLNSGDKDDALVKKRTETTEKQVQKQKQEPETKEIKKQKEKEIKEETPAKQTEHQFYEHKVQKGENLFRISKRYNVTFAQIKEANNLTSETLRYDQKIKIPVKAIHTVSSGESVGTIAQRYKSSTQDILKANEITNENQLKVGAKIIIPLSNN